MEKFQDLGNISFLREGIACCSIKEGLSRFFNFVLGLFFPVVAIIFPWRFDLNLGGRRHWNCILYCVR